jgi:hypothetical protein
VKYGRPPQYHELVKIVHQNAGVVTSRIRRSGARRAGCGSGPTPSPTRAGTMPDRALDDPGAMALPQARVQRSEQDAIPPLETPE